MTDKRKRAEYNKKWREDNKEKIAERGKKYREDNKEKIAERGKKYHQEVIKERRNNDSLFKMKYSLRHRTGQAFKNKGYKKNSKTEKMLGISYEKVKKHIGRQFQKGMTWSNHGEWHIDHIIPLSSAKTEAELLKLCHYRNLQPLWATDNLSKGSKIPQVQIQIKL